MSVPNNKRISKTNLTMVIILAVCAISSLTYGVYLIGVEVLQAISGQDVVPSNVFLGILPIAIGVILLIVLYIIFIYSLNKYLSKKVDGEFNQVRRERMKKHREEFDKKWDETGRHIQSVRDEMRGINKSDK